MANASVSPFSARGAAHVQPEANAAESWPPGTTAEARESPRIRLADTQPLEAASSGLKVRAQGSLCVHRMPALRALRASPCMRANFTHSALAPCS
jgi:hypothetical protein